MQRLRWTAATAAGLVGVLALAGCAGTEEPESPPAAPAEQSATPTPVAEPEASAEATPAEAVPSAAEAAGGYVPYSDYRNDPGLYSGADVVLFFNADWCPTCRVADANFSEEAFPAGLTVVSVDFDDNTQLRQQYGVTVQHTFVQVDQAGNEVAKWTGSNTVDQVAGKLA